jgi:hypothetical protein
MHVTVTNVFPDVVIKSCRFHLGQAWWRKIQALGLAKEYKKNVTDISKWLSGIKSTAKLSPTSSGLRKANPKKWCSHLLMSVTFFFYSFARPRACIFLHHDTIHGFKNGHYIPLVFCLLPSKSEACYRKMFSLLDDSCKRFNLDLCIKAIHLDFEDRMHAGECNDHS